MAKRTTVNSFKAAVGVAVLLIVALFAGTAGVSTLGSIFNPNHQTRLQRYVSGGRGDRVLVTVRGAGIRLAFPSDPRKSREAVHLIGNPIGANRLISTAGDDAVEFVWYRVPAPLASLKNLVEVLGGFAAGDLRGTVHDAERHPDSIPPAFQFRVPAPPKQKGDYYVRIMVDGGNVYVLRVRAKVDGLKALNSFASSYCVVGKTCHAAT